jgi:OOP family OmpA-OmpF porin
LGQATLTDRARQIIREAADISTKVQYTRDRGERLHRYIRHTEVQQGLSLRRATAVQTELIKNDVPQNAITI